ncbi:hypothetical protein LINPERPRIM_LOCUS33680 [Linum perenne]
MFAKVTSIKAAYAELQVAQNPYCIETIQSADHDVVEELKTLSHLKRSFVRDELDLISPQVTVMLAEIQEQQSLMKTYQIMIRKLEAETEAKSSKVDSMKKVLNECVAFNRSIEKKLNASGQLQGLGISNLNLNPSHFVQCLHYALRSVKSFVKLMVREMESASWDLDAAAEAIKPELGISISILNRSFVSESFVAKTMFEGFNHPGFTASKNDESSEDSDHQQQQRRRRRRTYEAVVVDVVLVVELVVEAIRDFDDLGRVTVLDDDEVVRLEGGPIQLKEEGPPQLEATTAISDFSFRRREEKEWRKRGRRRVFLFH